MVKSPSDSLDNLAQKFYVEGADNIRYQTRAEFGITDDHERQVRHVNVLSGFICFGLFVGFYYVIWKLWGGENAIFFLFFFFIPAGFLGVFHGQLSLWLTKYFVSKSYEYHECKRKIKRRLAAEYEKQRRAVMRSAKYWQGLNGHVFESEVVRLLKGHGYQAEITKASGDGGIDIIVTDRTGRIAIQCKRHNKPVGPAVARELYGVVKAGKFDKGMLFVTGGVTKGVHKFIEGKHIEIVDLPVIIQMEKELQGS